MRAAQPELVGALDGHVMAVGDSPIESAVCAFARAVIFRVEPLFVQDDFGACLVDREDVFDRRVFRIRRRALHSRAKVRISIARLSLKGKPTENHMIKSVVRLGTAFRVLWIEAQNG